MTIQNDLLTILPYVEDPENEQSAKEKGFRFGHVYEVLCARMNAQPPRRSVRRALSGMPDYVDHVGHTNGARWFKVRNTTMIRSEQRMHINTAIALRALERVATHELPASVFAELEEKFAQARATLDLSTAEHARHARSWDAKIMRIAGTQPLIRPPVDADIYRKVTDALLRGRKLEVRYEPNRAVRETKTYAKLSPLGLLDLAGLLYLIVHASGQKRMLRLDRMKRVTVLEQTARTEQGFDLESYVRMSHLAEHMSEPEVELKLRVHPREGEYARAAAQHMLTSFKLHEKQKITWAKDRLSFVVTATVRPSVSLRNFLHSQSDTIEVLAPAKMRAEFAERAHRMAQRYGVSN